MTLTTTRRIYSYVLGAILLLILFWGIGCRFRSINWNQGTNLHPDEYGLTNTLTQLQLPDNPSGYFNTRISPLSPYKRYDLAGQAVGDGPDNRMRWGQWPMILIRALAEQTHNTGYNELRLMGRYLSALLDTLTLLLAFLIGRRLYNAWVGLLGATFSSLAVMQIQQSHFMTVDNYATFFAALTLYAAVRIAQQPPLNRVQQGEGALVARYRFEWRAIPWYLLFGAGLGMSLTSKINLLPLAGMLLIAALISIAGLKLRTRQELGKVVWVVGLLGLLAGLVTLLTFRVTQPMSFRATSGDTTFWTVNPNPDWMESMQVASQESSGIGGGPPSEQWADRTAILFPLMNMVVWGMGLPLGIAAWVGLGWAGVQVLRRHPNWRAHLLPLVWSGGYFFFMATRWVKSVRYFLPIYPFLSLLAAWALWQLFVRAREGRTRNALTRSAFARSTLAWGVSILVIGGTLVWASAFTEAVYGQPHTRIQATQWILANIPGPFHLELTGEDGNIYLPVAAPEGLQIRQGRSYRQPVQVTSAGRLLGVTLPHVHNTGSAPAPLTIQISADAEGRNLLDEVTIAVPPSAERRGVEVQGVFQGAELKAGQTVYLIATTTTRDDLVVYRNTIANEDWDEGLPVRYAGYDPFGQFYQGVTMPVRWTDDEAKRQQYLEYLETVDYILLPSQRSIWSVCRLPRMYPMTLEYYRVLFDGRLGFEQAAVFQAPWKIGPLQISDTGGVLAWGEPPALPRFNFNFFAAEEAFSVYDHPPVWVFRKQPDFSLEQAHTLLQAIDLSQAVFQAPHDVEVSQIR